MQRFLVLTIVGLFGLGFFAQLSAQNKKQIQVMTKSGSGGFLGVQMETITPAIAKEKGLKTEEGALITEVTDGSPADSVGLKAGDIIVSIDGNLINAPEAAVKFIQKADAGTKISIEVIRAGEKKSFSAILGKSKTMKVTVITPDTPVFPSDNFFMNRSGAISSMRLRDLKGQFGKYFEAPDGRGILVEEVEEKSNAETAGFKAGDVIIAADKERMILTEDLLEVMNDHKKGEIIEIEIIRKGKKQSIKYTIEEECDTMLKMKLNNLHDGAFPKMFKFFQDNKVFQDNKGCKMMKFNKSDCSQDCGTSCDQKSCGGNCSGSGCGQNCEEKEVIIKEEIKL